MDTKKAEITELKEAMLKKRVIPNHKYLIPFHKRVKPALQILHTELFPKKTIEAEMPDPGDVMRQMLAQCRVVVGAIQEMLKNEKYSRSERKQFVDDFLKFESVSQKVFAELIEHGDIKKTAAEIISKYEGK